MTVYAVHTNDTGTLVSVGTVIATPLPANLTALALTDGDATRLRTGAGIWDAATRSVIDNPAKAAELVAETNMATITSRVQPHIDALKLIKNSAGTLSGLQLSNAVRALAAAQLDTLRYLHSRLDTLD